MHASDGTLLERWQARRDARAFQEIVSRHGAMVYGVCRRILRNASDAEDITQDCFLALAQTDVKRVRTLGAWLHTFATSRSLDRLRADKRREFRERDWTGTRPTKTEPTWEDIQGFVDEAVAELPERYCAVVVGHFFEGQTQAEIAQSLDLSPSAVSRRIDHAVKHMRESLRKRGVLVAVGTLPGLLANAASAPLPAPLLTSLGKIAISGTSDAHTATAPALVSGFAGSTFAKWGLAAISVAVVATLGVVIVNRASPAPAKETDSATATVPAPQNVFAQQTSVEPATETVPEQRNASISGYVVYSDTGDVATDVRVMLGTREEELQTTLTDNQGAFAFRSVPAGQVALLAYDARYEETPEDDKRSEHVGMELVDGETRENVVLKVPPRGGEVSGVVADSRSGTPLGGIRVNAFRFGGPSHDATTDQQGHYTLFGLAEGEWYVRLDESNPIFADNTTESIDRVLVAPGKTTELSFAVDRSLTVRGTVVDAQGNPVSDAAVNAVLFINDGSGRRRCSVKSDAQGRFTLWGAFGGERVEVSARKRPDLASASEIANFDPDQFVDGILLTLFPEVTVTGRFEDQRGRPVKANIWWRAKHPNGYGSWSGQSGAPSESFEIALARGEYEIKGKLEGRSLGSEDTAHALTLPTDAASDILVTMRTDGSHAGPYALRGTVFNEKGEPLRKVRVYTDGPHGEHSHTSTETYTDANGQFAFDGLKEGQYRVHAVPETPYEQYGGFDDINPATTPEVEIVVRLAAQLLGRVVDARTGDPIKHFQAEIGELSHGEYKTRWELKPVTSESGAFEMSARLDADWFIRIAADGYAEAEQAGAPLHSGEIVNDIEFRLSPGRVVQGTVTDAEDEFIPNALVFVNEDVFDVTRNDERYAAATTDAEGLFTLASVPDDSAYLYVLKTGYAVAQAAIRDQMTVVLRDGGVIEGQITIGAVAPPAGTNIIAFTAVNGAHAHASGRTDEHGRYRISELMDGSYNLQFTLRDERRRPIEAYYLEQTVEAANGTVTTQDIVIPLGTATVSGTIYANGKPVPRLSVRCSRAGFYTFTQTDEAGQYQIGALPKGIARIAVRIPNDGDPRLIGYTTIHEMHLNPGETVEQSYDLGGQK